MAREFSGFRAVFIQERKGQFFCLSDFHAESNQIGCLWQYGRKSENAEKDFHQADGD